MSRDRDIKETALSQYLSNTSDSSWRDKVEERKANKEWLKKSTRIAIKLNRFLKESKISQKKLARKLGVSPQQINKILKGTENLTLESISRLEAALGIELITILNSNEIVIKTDFGSFAQSIANKVFKQNLNFNLDMVYQQYSDVQILDTLLFEAKTHTKASDYVSVSSKISKTKIVELPNAA